MSAAWAARSVASTRETALTTAARHSAAWIYALVTRPRFRDHDFGRSLSMAIRMSSDKFLAPSLVFNTEQVLATVL